MHDSRCLGERNVVKESAKVFTGVYKDFSICEGLESDNSGGFGIDKGV